MFSVYSHGVRHIAEQQAGRVGRAHEYLASELYSGADAGEQRTVVHQQVALCAVDEGAPPRAEEADPWSRLPGDVPQPTSRPSTTLVALR